MLVNEYETTLVLRPDMGGDAIESTLDRVRDSVKKMGGTLLAIDHWGRKKLAYPIKKQTRGFYIHTHYLGKDDLVAEVERNLRISDAVVRYLTVRVEESVQAVGREVQAYVRPEYETDIHSDDERGSVDAAEAKPEMGDLAESVVSEKAAEVELTKPEQSLVSDEAGGKALSAEPATEETEN